MEEILLLDKKFRKFISHESIKKAIDGMAARINCDLKHEDVLFICVLNGSFMFASDLFREITIENAEITFVKLSSYNGMDSTGRVKELIGLNESLEGRTLIVVEDIIDTGITINEVVEIVKTNHPKSIKIATLLLKPDKFGNKMDVDYVGIEIGNEFIVGYGLDYNKKGRNLKDIYVVSE